MTNNFDTNVVVVIVCVTLAAGVTLWSLVAATNRTALTIGVIAIWATVVGVMLAERHRRKRKA